MKLNWKKVIKAIWGLINLGVSTYLLYILTLRTYITGEYSSLNWIGLYILILSLGWTGVIYSDFKKDFEKVSRRQRIKYLNKIYSK